MGNSNGIVPYGPAWRKNHLQEIMSQANVCVWNQVVLSLVARRATYVVDGRLFAHYFWKVAGTVRIHVYSRVAPVHGY